MRKSACYFVLLLPFSGIWTGVQAATLTDAIRQSWNASPQIRGQETQASLASGDRWRRFIFNEPQFNLANTDDSTALSYGLSLSVGLPGQAIALSKIDSAKEFQQNSELIGKKQDLAKAIAQTYLDCAGNQALARIQDENIRDLSTIQNSLKFLYESGHSSQSDTIQAELQLRQAASDFLSLQDRAHVACRKMDDIMIASGVQEKPELELPDDIDSTLLADLGSSSGDVRRAESAGRLALANLDTAGWSQLPDLTLNAQRNHYLYLPGSPSGKDWANSYAVLVTLPLLFPFHETVEASRIRSQARIDEATASLQLASARADEDDGAREYRRSKARLAELRHKDLSLAEALRESVLSAYRSGKVGFADLVLARKTYSDLKAQEITLRSSVINAHLRCLNQCSVER